MAHSSIHDSSLTFSSLSQRVPTNNWSMHLHLFCEIKYGREIKGFRIIGAGKKMKSDF